jgi:hypothetical protein
LAVGHELANDGGRSLQFLVREPGELRRVERSETA